MPEESKEKAPQPESKPRQQQSPLVFISHDTRDAEIAEAFSALLRRVTAGMLKSFRSSDKTGTEGIEFGDEWYKRLMTKLDAASDVVCLFTERSLERPWILYEAGVAKAKLDRSVLGIALGVPLSRVGTGPFYQFQNSDDSEESLSKLVLQLSRRIPTLEPDPEVVQTQVHAFKESVDQLLAQLQEDGSSQEETPSEASTAKLLEELKFIVRDLPARVEKQLGDPESPQRSRRRHQVHSKMFDEVMRMLPERSDNPIAVLIFASMFRDDVPWLYELGREVYTSFYSRSPVRRQQAAQLFLRALDWTMHGPTAEMLIEDSEHMYMMLMESRESMRPVLERMIHGTEEL